MNALVFCVTCDRPWVFTENHPWRCKCGSTTFVTPAMKNRNRKTNLTRQHEGLTYNDKRFLHSLGISPE